MNWLWPKIRVSWGLLVWRLEDSGWKQRLRQRGNPSKLWDSDHRLTTSCSHNSCCRSDVKLRFFWQRCATYLAWFCLWPNRWETSWTCVLGSSWGSTGPQGWDSAKIPCPFGKIAVTTQHRGDMLYQKCSDLWFPLFTTLWSKTLTDVKNKNKIKTSSAG